MKPLSLGKQYSRQPMTALTLTCLAIIAYAMTCCAYPANAGEPLPKITAETLLSDEQVKNALSESDKELTSAKQGLESMLEKLGPGHPRMVRAKAVLEQMHKVHALQEELFPLLVGPRDEEKQKEITRLVKELDSVNQEVRERFAALEAVDEEDAKHRAFEQELHATRQQLEETQRQLAERQLQLTKTAEQMAKSERDRALPPLDNAEVKVYRLTFAPAGGTADAVEALLGAQAVRVASDERTNSLVVYAKPQSLPAIDALVERLDQHGRVNDDGIAPQTPPPIMLRVFWLADGLPVEEGTDPAEFLPASVLRAIKKLGLNNPRLVTQTVNSLAADSGDVDFSTNVPALLLNQMVGFNCTGKMKRTGDNQIGLGMQINVMGPGIHSELKGSIVTPLMHFMVLGTANSVIADQAAMQGMGMGGEMGPEGVAGFAVGGPPRSPAPGEMGMEGGEGMAQQQPAKYSTSRFAFVVQVIEGESFPPEE